MSQLRDPIALMRPAQIGVWVYVAAQVVNAAASLWLQAVVLGSAPLGTGTIADLLNLFGGVVLLLSFIPVGMWIYRVAWNANELSGWNITSPGWAVGWYFIPFANLFKPFQAMKEVWMASHGQWDGYAAETPGVLRWWWGLWIVTSILANISTRLYLDSSAATMLGAIVMLDLAVALLSVPLGLFMARIIETVSNLQTRIPHQETFA